MAAYDLNGKTALVTGAARGIGYEAARRLHLRGASIAVVDLDTSQAREAAERIGARAIGIAADVTDIGAMRAAVAETVERFGGLDVAVANAGIAPPTVTTTRMVPAEEWERVLEINLLGVWHTVRAALPEIVEHGGQLVLISSAYAFLNGMLNSSYATAKAGVEALGRSLRTELSPLGAGVTIAYFGWVDTKLVQDVFAQPSAARLEDYIPSVFMRRITAAAAADALVRGIEKRAPHVFEPGWWRYVSAIRGVFNPLFDRRSIRDPRLARALLEAEGLASGEASPASG